MWQTELLLLSCSGKLYIQLYPSNLSTQTCQTAMLLQRLDVTAGRLTLAHAPAVATVRQESHSAPAPAAATVQQQGALFGAACPCRALT